VSTSVGQPTLVHEATMRVVVEPAEVVGRGPFGTRLVAAATGGTVVGPRLTGTIAGPGADWVLAGEDGFGRVDVRLQIRTDDGALVYAIYDGLLELNVAVLGALADPGAETAWDDQYFRIAPRFETGADRYAWLQRSLFVGRGRIAAHGVEYELYRVT